MATENLQIVIEAVNRASSVLDKAKSDFKKFSDDAQKSVEKVQERFQKVGEKMQKVGKSLTVGLTLPIAAAGAASVKLASDMEETMNKIDVVFQDNAKEVEKWGGTTLKQFGIAKQTSLDMAALFGDMATSMGINTDAASKMSTKLVGLAGDLASFKNIRIDVAQTALNGIFTGETESLKQLGIVMTQANLEQFALSQGIQKSIQDMTEAEKVNLRYAFVLSKTTNAQGDFARTSDGAANQMRIFQENLKEIGVQLGEILLPIFNKAITFVNGLLEKFQGLSPTMQKVVVVSAGVFAAIGPLITIAGTLATSITALIPVFAAAKVAIAGLTGPIGIAIAAIGVLTVLVVKNFDKIKSAIKKSTETSKKFIKASWEDKIEMLGKAVKVYFDIQMAMWKDILSNTVVAVKKLGQLFIDGFNMMVKAFEPIGDFLAERFIAIKEWIANFSFSDAIEEIGKSILNGLVNIGKKITEGATKVFNSFKNALKGDFSGFDIGDLLTGGKTTQEIVSQLADSSIVLGLEKFTKDIRSGFNDIVTAEDFGFSNTKQVLSQFSGEVTSQNRTAGITEQVESVGSGVDTTAIEDDYNRALASLQTYDAGVSDVTKSVAKTTKRRVKSYKMEQSEIEDTEGTHDDMKKSMIRGNNQIVANLETTVEQMKKKYEELRGVLNQIRSITAPKDGPDKRTDAQVFAISGAQQPISPSVFGPSTRSNSVESNRPGPSSIIRETSPISISVGSVDSTRRVTELSAAVTRALQLKRKKQAV